MTSHYSHCAINHAEIYQYSQLSSFITPQRPQYNKNIQNKTYIYNTMTIKLKYLQFDSL